MQNALLKCTGIDNVERAYDCIIEQDNDSWHFSVFDKERKLKNPSQLTVRLICSDMFQVTMMTHNGETEYSKKGIHDTLIPFVAERLVAKVISSKGLNLESGDYQLKNAEKIWLRLVERGKAVFNKNTSRFECPP